jgi:hypothetical protein
LPAASRLPCLASRSVAADSKSSRGFTLDGNFVAQKTIEELGCLWFEGATNLVIDGMIIRNASNDGISFKGKPSSNVVVSNNRIVNCGRNEVAILSGNNVLVYGNRFEQCGLVNIDLEPNSGNVVKDCTVLYNFGVTAPLGHIAVAGGDGLTANISIVGNTYHNDKKKRKGSVTQATPTTNPLNVTLIDDKAQFLQWDVRPGDMLFTTVHPRSTGYKVVCVISEIELIVRKAYGSGTPVVPVVGDTYTFYGEKLPI